MGLDQEEKNMLLAFKKAMLRHQFDRTFAQEVAQMEDDHYAVMGAIIEFSKAGMAG